MDGWDFEEDALFCPDWVAGDEDWDDEIDDDLDDDLDDDFALDDFDDLKDCEKD